MCLRDHIDGVRLRLVVRRRRKPAQGSKRRAKTTLERLQEQGYQPEELSRIHTPLGLDIAAETPAEIAVAIAAELIRVRRGGSLETLSLSAKARPSGPFKFTGN